MWSTMEVYELIDLDAYMVMSVENIQMTQRISNKTEVGFDNHHLRLFQQI